MNYNIKGNLSQISTNSTTCDGYDQDSAVKYELFGVDIKTQS